MRYCYLVYCNVDPIIYAVYSNLKSARKYTDFLLKVREKDAKERGLNFSYYHYFSNQEKDSDFEKFHDKLIFSACCQITSNIKGLKYYDDGCVVKVVRRPLKSYFDEKS